MTKAKLLWTGVAASVAMGTPALADWTIVSQDRFVDAYAYWLWTFGVPAQEQQQTLTAPNAGPFVQTAAVQFGNAPNINSRGHGSQNSTLGPDLITAQGRAEGEATRGSIGSVARGEGESFFEVRIDLAEPTMVRLQGRVAADRIGVKHGQESAASIELAPTGAPALVSIVARYYQGPPLVEVDQSILLAPGEYTLTARAWANSLNGHMPGTAFIVVGDFDLTLSVDTCYPDCDGDGLLTLADFGCFQTKFALGDLYADCNADQVLNLADFGCFQTRFALGCP